MQKANVGPAVQLSAVVIRACRKCNGPRELNQPCVTCGSTEPAEITDLGVIAAARRTRWDRLKWNLWGFRAAQRRIRKINQQFTKSAA